MTRDEVLNSIQLKKRFCKDCGLPITVFENPYFYERLSILDVQFDCIKKFNTFCAELMPFDCEQEYFEYYNSVKDEIITYIRNNPTYQKFNIATFDKQKLQIDKRNLYIEPNDGGRFISVDMKKANFSAMNYYSPLIFMADTWEKFIGKYTSSQHIINSKYIRQVILGACNPRQQTRYENCLMSTLCKHIIDSFRDSLHVYSLGEDEIIITIKNSNEDINPPLDFSLKKFRKVLNSCPSGISQLVRIEMFDLYKLDNIGWMKVDCNGARGVEFKCVDGEIYHQVIKHFFNVPIIEDDLVVYHNGRLAKFLEQIGNPFCG